MGLGVEHLAHSPGQDLGPEGLLKERRAGIQQASPGGLVVGVARDVEQPHPGPAAAQSSDMLQCDTLSEGVGTARSGACGGGGTRYVTEWEPTGRDGGSNSSSRLLTLAAGEPNVGGCGVSLSS